MRNMSFLGSMTVRGTSKYPHSRTQDQWTRRMFIWAWKIPSAWATHSSCGKGDGTQEG